MPPQDSISRQHERKEIAVRELIVHISEVENTTFTREYQVNLLDKIRYPDWNNNSKNNWTYFIDVKVRDSWHHLDDFAKLVLYLTILRNQVM